jgi:hypothetical protein
MKRRSLVPLLVLSAMLCACGTAFAAPALLQYQGRLTDASGIPLNGAQTALFTVYDDSVGTTPLWSERRTVTPVNGLFDIALGMGTPIGPGVFDGTARFLGIRVWPDSTADMLPRQRISSAAYSLNAGRADVAGAASTFAHARSGANTYLQASTWVNYSGAVVSLTTPGPGYIVVTANFNIILSQTAGVSKTVEAGIGQTPTTGPAAGGPDTWIYLSPTTFPAGNMLTDGQCTSVYNVGSAGTYTYYLNGYVNAGQNGGDNFNWANMTAVYYYNPSPTSPTLPAKAGKQPADAQP